LMLRTPRAVVAMLIHSSVYLLDDDAHDYAYYMMLFDTIRLRSPPLSCLLCRHYAVFRYATILPVDVCLMP